MTFQLPVRIVTLSIILGLSAAAWAQRGAADAAKTPPSVEAKIEAAGERGGHVEFPRDAHLPTPSQPPAAPGGVILRSRDGYVSVQVNVNALGNNIVGDAANEPSIAVDPTNPTRMVIGWRQFDNVNSDFRQAGYGYTGDGGYTWTFPGVIEPGVFRSDPVLDADAEGNFYYNSLTATPDLTDFWCHVYKSIDGGATWDAGTYAFGGDKQWQAIDTTDGIGKGNVYAQWNAFFSTCSGNFTRSYDNGQTFQPCTTVPGSPYWGVLAVGPDGALYVSGTGMSIAKSSTMQDPGQAVAWDFNQFVDLDGSLEGHAGPNPGGLLGQCWVAVDHSGGPSHNNVYMLASVGRASNPDPLDVMFTRSTNGGTVWSAPVRVNDDIGTSAWQWLGTLSVAPNGRIDAIWLDTRNDPGGYDSELFYAFSTDAGVTWSPNEVLSPPFDPHIGWPQQNKMGDYFDMISDDLGANLAYAATFNGEQDVYFIRIGDPLCSEAGEVKLERSDYACEDTVAITVVDCGLNTDSDVIETVTVAIDSDSETGVETVLLTEQSPAAALFEGTIQASETDGAGVLLIAEGDTVTVTYVDADDGAGGVNIPVTALATVDCTPPVISNVQTSDIGPRTADVSFDANEPVRGTVYYGTDCATLTGSAAGAGSHDVTQVIALAGLDDNTAYDFAVQAADVAGNTAYDDAGGSCYTFTTTDVPSFFTEEFSGDNDLDNRSLRFTASASVDGYEACVEEITELPVDPGVGAQVSISEDGCYTAPPLGVPLGTPVVLYGVSYDTVHICDNGYITFTGTDSDWTESIPEHFEMPRISALYDDLSVDNGVRWAELADRVVVTYNNVPEYNTGNSNTFQVEMHFNGDIVLSYLSVAANDGIVGLSAGLGEDPDFLETDLSGLAVCAAGVPGDFNGDGQVDIDDYDLFAGCFTGPDGGPVDPGCDPGDMDGDGDIDCDDWNLWVLTWTAPGMPPELPACQNVIPTVSEWGLAFMSLLMLAAGSVVLARRRPARA